MTSVCVVELNVTINYIKLLLQNNAFMENVSRRQHRNVRRTSHEVYDAALHSFPDGRLQT